MRDDPASADPARGRFLVIQMLRLSGLAFVLVGIAILNGAIALPEVAGYALFGVGIVDALIMPTVLSRMWKSPPP